MSDLISVMYVPEGKSPVQFLHFERQEDLDRFVAIHFRGGSVEHDCTPVRGFTKYLQEYNPMHFNDTAIELFEKYGIEECGGILGNILFY